MSLDELRELSLWTADCAERALPLFESAVPGDRRARDAIEAVREFGAGGKRTKAIRTTAWAALKAAGELDDVVIHSAVDCVPPSVREVLARYPDGAPGRTRLGELHRQLETELRRPSTS